MPRALKNLHLKGYRAFADFRLGDLGPVNLIVGRNNAGKTSVLEAIRLLASGGEPAVLYQTAVDRGETLVPDTEGVEYRRDVVVADVSHFFHGHAFGAGSSFEVASGNGLGSLRTEVIEVDAVEQGETLWVGADPTLFGVTAYDATLALRLTGSVSKRPRRSTAIMVSDDGGLSLDAGTVRRMGAARATGHVAPVPAVFITPASLQTSFMAGMWDRVIREGREKDAVAALQILQPDIEAIFFLPGERATRARAGVLVGLTGVRHRVPLGSMGEGMRRVLALALSLAQARKGFLLVDEFDTGLHWSVMARVWELTIRTAADLGVQVFATTHSLDCLQGLKEAVDADDRLGGAVRVHKVDTALRQAVTFTAEDLAVAIEQEIEVRG